MSKTIKVESTTAEVRERLMRDKEEQIIISTKVDIKTESTSYLHEVIGETNFMTDANLAWKLLSAESAFKANLVDLVDVEDQERLESEEEDTGKGKGKEKEVVEEENEEEKGDHLPSDLSKLDRNL
ncbi:hypothetical protein Clacol_001124 [Clathrus columnatus]|uniref:Uncharacterized protein n=1 Tax=Clathrus columnatus TaxID=1419009 RepID=A0AAV5A2R8_9AGAM|nr:hypothetical protein Clacol_001124 [Clathrus columnatus]